MINLYTWATPNGRKVSIMLEELAVPYQVHAVNLSQNQQFDPEFLRISPNNKIPAIVDQKPDNQSITVFESGAILTYLAEQHQQFLAPSGAERYKTMEWLHWQVAGLGPMVGQLVFFERFTKEKSAQASQRFLNESNRLLQVMDNRLSESRYLGGDNYSIADMACYPWLISATQFIPELLAHSVQAKAGLSRWLDEVGQRPAVQRGMKVPVL